MLSHHINKKIQIQQKYNYSEPIEVNDIEEEFEWFEARILYKTELFNQLEKNIEKEFSSEQIINSNLSDEQGTAINLLRSAMIPANPDEPGANIDEIYELVTTPLFKRVIDIHLFEQFGLKKRLSQLINGFIKEYEDFEKRASLDRLISILLNPNLEINR